MTVIVCENDTLAVDVGVKNAALNVTPTSQKSLVVVMNLSLCQYLPGVDLPGVDRCVICHLRPFRYCLLP